MTRRDQCLDVHIWNTKKLYSDRHFMSGYMRFHYDWTGAAILSANEQVDCVT